MTIPRKYLHVKRWRLCRKYGEMEDGTPKWKPIKNSTSLDKIWERHQDFLFWGDIKDIAEYLLGQDEVTLNSDRGRSRTEYTIGEQTFQIVSEY